jgi:hypothetical protein
MQSSTSSWLQLFPQLKRTMGYTVAEIIVVVGLIGLLALLAIGTIIAAKQLVPGRTLQVGAETLALAPSPAAFADAVGLQRVFGEWIAGATAIYVFGGSHQNLPAGASRLADAPLTRRSLPEIDSFAKGLPLDAHDFYVNYEVRLGTKERDPSPVDFTVLTVGPVDGRLAVTSMLQVRGANIPVSDGGLERIYARREVELYDLSGEKLAYAFLENSELADLDAVGARHFWLRYSEGRVAEEAPALVVLPDPSIYAGEQVATRSAPTQAFSRFSYFLAVNP